MSTPKMLGGCVSKLVFAGRGRAQGEERGQSAHRTAEGLGPALSEPVNRRRLVEQTVTESARHDRGLWVSSRVGNTPLSSFNCPPANGRMVVVRRNARARWAAHLLVLPQPSSSVSDASTAALHAAQAAREKTISSKRLAQTRGPCAGSPPGVRCACRHAAHLFDPP